MPDSDDKATVFNNWGASCYDHAKMKQEKDVVHKFSSIHNFFED